MAALRRTASVVLPAVLGGDSAAIPSGLARTVTGLARGDAERKLWEGDTRGPPDSKLDTRGHTRTFHARERAVCADENTPVAVDRTHRGGGRLVFCFLQLRP